MIETTIILGSKVQFLACDICGKRYASTVDMSKVGDIVKARQQAQEENCWMRDNGKDVCNICRWRK